MRQLPPCPKITAATSVHFTGEYVPKKIRITRFGLGGLLEETF
jgi:hypothetical protein